MTEQRPFTFDRVVRILLSLGILAGVIWLAGYLSDVLIPFAVALLLAYLTNPLVNLVQKKISNRAAAVFISLLVIIALAVLLGWFVIPMIAGEIVQMGRMVTDLVNNSDLAERASKQLPPDLWQVIKNFFARTEIKDFFKDISIWKILKAVSQKVLPGVWGLITGTASFFAWLIGLFVIGLYFIFLLLDYEAVRGWKELVPPAYRESIVGLVDDFESAMSNYFRGQAAVASICGVLFAIGFALIGLPLGILLGLFVGLLNMVPYLQIIGLIPAGLAGPDACRPVRNQYLDGSGPYRPCLPGGTGYPGYYSGSQNNGQGYRVESGHDHAVAVHLGETARSARNDNSPAGDLPAYSYTTVV